MLARNLKDSITHIPEQTVPPRGRAVSSPWARNLLTFLMVFGPGLIVMEADNDAGAVSTYVQAGAQYGTHLLWILIVLLPMTYFVQEMVVRLGIATGQGHAAMITNALEVGGDAFPCSICSSSTS
jgi:Mn2+/Fe2+ NRAMP family transporter